MRFSGGKGGGGLNTRWPKIASLFDSLSGLGDAQRLERLRRLGDGETVAELRDLLSHYDQAGSHFLATTGSFAIDQPKNVATPYAFNPGDRVAGRFVVMRQHGRGSMGEVYEAKDVQSGNRVALKCIGTASATDDAALLFRREIEMARQIADPNICRVHDIFEHSSEGRNTLLLSMEFIDGENLEQRIARAGAMAIAEARPLVLQLLSGIAAAHREGVIHRDLKPGNIMLARTRNGERLVITDFGIARQQHAPGDSAASGGIAGTFEYMAPEQLLGENSVASDIYAAGLIIFEMLAGRKPFTGAPLQQALRRIAEPIPKIKSVCPKVPSLWEGVIGRCLERDPAKRFQSAKEVARALEAEAAILKKPRVRFLAASGVAIAVLSLLAAVGLTGLRSNAPSTPPLSPETTGGGLTLQSAISPNGAWLAYVSDRASNGNLQLWIQKTGVEASRKQITSDGNDTSSPWFSNDGKKVIFRWERDGSGLYIADVPDGEPRLLVHSAVEGRFSPNGKSVVYWTGELAEHPTTLGRIYQVSLSGGEPRRLVPEFATASNPVFLSNGKILFEGVRMPGRNYESSADWFLLDPATGFVQATGAMDGLRRLGLRRYNRMGNFVGDKLFFSARSLTAANVYRYRFDAGDGRVRGSPQQITFTTALMESPSVTESGLMAITNSSGSLNVWQLPLQGSGPDRRITTSIHYDTHPTVSADGLAVAFGRSLGRDREIWLRTPSGERALVTTHSEEKYWPVIRADGSEVAYSANKGATHSIFVVRTSDGAVETVCAQCGAPLHFSRDGQSLLVFQETAGRISILDRKTKEMRTVVQGPSDLAEAQFSPDNRFIAFRETTGANRARIWIAPVDSRGPVPRNQWIPVTSDEAWNDKPRWPEDSRTVYFLSTRDGFACIWAQGLNAKSSQATGEARPVRHFHSHTFTPSEASRIAFNFAIAKGHIIANPAAMQGDVWTGQLIP